MAGLGLVQTSRYAGRTVCVGRRSRDVLATLRIRRAAANHREAGVGRHSSCFGSARPLRARRWPRRSGGVARACYGAVPHYTRSHGRRATDGPRALLVLWPYMVAYGLADTLDARAASDDARATSSLPDALVELLPTAARRASGSAPHASVRHALYGLADGRGARAAPHALATAPPFTTRARAAVVLPTGRERCSCSGRTRSRTDQSIR